MQARKTKLNLILINLIVSDLFIIFVGIPIDAFGAFSFGSGLDDTFCTCVAFTHTLFGNVINIYLNLFLTYFRNFISVFNLIFHLNYRNEFIVHINNHGSDTMSVCVET